MKKILLFLLLFVNLQIVFIDDYYAPMLGMQASAQVMDTEVDENSVWYCKEQGWSAETPYYYFVSPIPCEGVVVTADKPKDPGTLDDPPYTDLKGSSKGGALTGTGSRDGTAGTGSVRGTSSSSTSKNASTVEAPKYDKSYGNPVTSEDVDNLKSVFPNSDGVNDNEVNSGSNTGTTNTDSGQGGLGEDSQYTNVRSTKVKITFDKGADNPVNKKLVSYLENVLTAAKANGITSINVSSTTNHTSNASKSAHSLSNGARALDINYINGVHVGDNELSKRLQLIIQSTSGWLENYGPNIIEKKVNGNVVQAPWARNFPGGHRDHIHISVPR